jgi:SAM-dependent methyltransferase
MGKGRNNTPARTAQVLGPDLAKVDRRRPFYSEYAWAFDLLIDRPVRKECAAIVSWLNDRGVLPGATILDAGCGTGRYSIELARRGFVVRGVDSSPELVEQATRAAGDRGGLVSFTVGDILALPPASYDAILCRGVLNDVVDDGARRSAFLAFSGALRPGGVLIVDVREWEATAERKTREPLFRKRVLTDCGRLTFTSVTEVDRENRRLVVTEQHALLTNNGERCSDYVFVMRCWSREELQALSAQCGFGRLRFFGAYDNSIAAGQTDRLVAVSQHLGRS